MNQPDLGPAVFNTPAIVLANYIIQKSHALNCDLSSIKLQATLLLLEGATQAKFAMPVCNYKHYYVYSITCYLPEIYLAFKNETLLNQLHVKSKVYADPYGKIISKPYPKLNSAMLNSDLKDSTNLIFLELDKLICSLLKNQHIIDQIIKPDIQNLPQSNTSLISQMPEYNPGHIAYLFIKNKDKI